MTIGVTTAVPRAVGLYIGRRFGSLLGKRLDVVGGLALIGLGTHVLIEHFRRRARNERSRSLRPCS